MAKTAYFKIPKTIKHKEVRTIINNLVRELNEKGFFSQCDIPNLHRMVTAYDTYLSCVELVEQVRAINMVNLKGELVKRPEMNILKESWTQYLEIAKEYGLTKTARGRLKHYKLKTMKYALWIS